MSEPTDQHARLEFFCGSWTGEETLYPSPWDPEGGSAVGRFTNRMLDGFFLINDYEQERDGRVVFRGHGIYGWNAAKECFTMRWVDSSGVDPGEAIPGRWAGNHLVFQANGSLGHRRYAYTVEDDRTFTFTLSTSQDGATWMPYLEGRYQRS